MLPVAEVRGAIPLAFALLRDNPQQLLLGVILGVAGNMAVAPILIPLLSFIERRVLESSGKLKLIRAVYERGVAVARRRARGLKAGSYIALAVFVAVPLPVTGAWTASLIAHILGMDKRKAVLAIEAGVAAASLIVFTATYLGVEALKHLLAL